MVGERIKIHTWPGIIPYICALGGAGGIGIPIGGSPEAGFEDFEELFMAFLAASERAGFRGGGGRGGSGFRVG